jgi:hypothetical protein
MFGCFLRSGAVINLKNVSAPWSQIEEQRERVFPPVELIQPPI